MHRRRSVAVTVAIIATLVASCAGLDAGVGDLRGEAAELPEDARLCLAIARAVSAVESASPDTAADAAEEVLAQAPDDLAAIAGEVVDHLRAAAQEGDITLRDPELREAADRLRERTRELCDPS